ncbi:hypothetical protein LCGC14_2806910 [marine sediment metagenome]|uniref:HNH domain-containing protein n=1 Tax=marine sediment metagenome TaxID=412755 RepID=A0A0F8YL21_9ZZZZ
MVAPSRTPEARSKYYQAHLDDWQAYNREYYLNHRAERLAYNQVHREEQLAYQQTYGQAHREERKMKKAEMQQRLSQLKLCAGCCRCGYAANSVALAFHHARDDKDISIANAVRRGWGWERIETELEKCDVVCHNCHAIIHWGK